MDSNKTTQYVAALCIAGLVFLFARWGVDIAIGPEPIDTHHADAEHGETVTQAYAVETGEGEAHGAEGEGEGAVEVAMLEGDAAAGEKGFKKCQSCHKINAGEHSTGPSLAGIGGRVVGSAEGFKYSKAMEEVGASGQVWDTAYLNAFLADVKGTIPGTKMSFAGIKNDQQRADIIAYLETLQ